VCTVCLPVVVGRGRAKGGGAKGFGAGPSNSSSQRSRQTSVFGRSSIRTFCFLSMPVTMYTLCMYLWKINYLLTYLTFINMTDYLQLNSFFFNNQNEYHSNFYSNTLNFDQRLAAESLVVVCVVLFGLFVLFYLLPFLNLGESEPFLFIQLYISRVIIS